MDQSGDVTGAVRELVAQLDDPDAALRAKAALAIRLAQQLDFPEEGKGIAAVARELRMTLQELAASRQSDNLSKLDRVLGHMAKPSAN